MIPHTPHLWNVGPKTFLRFLRFVVKDYLSQLLGLILDINVFCVAVYIWTQLLRSAEVEATDALLSCCVKRVLKKVFR